MGTIPLHTIPAGIDEAKIEEMVRTFYVRVRSHPVLGPIFGREIGEDWEPHLLKMMDFWSSVLLTTGRYKGRPLPVHQRLSGVQPEHFTVWLELFGETVAEIFEREPAELITEKASRIARSFQIGMFYDPAKPVE